MAKQQIKVGRVVQQRVKKALAQGIITKKDASNILKSASGRSDSLENSFAQNRLLEKIKIVDVKPKGDSGVSITFEVSEQSKPRQSIKDTKTFGGYVETRNKVEAQRERGDDELQVRRALLKDIQPVFDAANKRIKRLSDMESAGVVLPALKSLREDKPTGNFSSAGKSVDDLIKEYTIAVRFMNHSTSTIKGAKHHIETSLKAFGGSVKQATQRRYLLDTMLQDDKKFDSPNYADFTTWISTNISTMDQFDEAEVRRKVEEIEERRRQEREYARKRAAEMVGKPKISSKLLRQMMNWDD